MITNTSSSVNYFKTFNLIFFALLAGQVFFASLTLYLNANQLFETSASLSETFIYVVPVIVISALVSSRVLYKSRINSIKQLDELSQKLQAYPSAMIVRMALLEGASLFATVIYLITGDIVFIMLSFVVILYFLMLKPSIDKIADDLELNQSARTKLHRGESIT